MECGALPCHTKHAASIAPPDHVTGVHASMPWQGSAWHAFHRLQAFTALRCSPAPAASSVRARTSSAACLAAGAGPKGQLFGWQQWELWLRSTSDCTVHVECLKLCCSSLLSRGRTVHYETAVAHMPPIKQQALSPLTLLRQLSRLACRHERTLAYTPHHPPIRPAAGWHPPCSVSSAARCLAASPASAARWRTSAVASLAAGRQERQNAW